MIAAAVTYLGGEDPSEAPQVKDLELKSETFVGDIAIGETMAIEMQVGRIIHRAKLAKRRIKLIVIATDNLGCKSWFERGHAQRHEIQIIIHRVNKLLSQERIRMCLVYVPSAPNFTDAPSRNLPWKLELLQNNHHLLNAARMQAMGMWNMCGGRIGGMDRDAKIMCIK
jgi:hypothetical protein